MLRVVSAFLFATALLVLIVIGSWFVVVNRAETRLRGTLPELLGADLTYQGVERHYDVGRIHLTLKNAVLANANMRYQLGDIAFTSDFFGRYKQELKLGQRQTVTLLEEGRPVQSYQLSMENGVFQLFPSTREWVFGFLSVAVHQQQQELLRVGIMDVTAKWAEKNVADMMVTLKQVSGQPLADAPAVNIPSLLFKGRMTHVPAEWSQWVWALLRQPTGDVWRQGLQNGVQAMAQAGSHVMLENLMYRRGDDSLVLTGRLGLDKRVRLLGSVEVLVSKQAFMQNLLTGFGLSHVATAEANPDLAALFAQGEQAPFSYTVRLQRGDVYVDNVKAGILLPVPTLLGLVEEKMEMEPFVDPAENGDDF